MMPLSFSTVESERAGVDDCEFSFCWGCSLDKKLGRPIVSSIYPIREWGDRTMTGIDRIGEKKEKKREKREQAPGEGGNAGFLYEPSHHTGRPTQHTLISGLTTENRAENRKSHRGHSGAKKPCVGRNARGERTIACGQAHARRLTREMGHSAADGARPAKLIEREKVKGKRKRLLPLNARVGSLVGHASVIWRMGELGEETVERWRWSCGETEGLNWRCFFHLNSEFNCNWDAVCSMQ